MNSPFVSAVSLLEKWVLYLDGARTGVALFAALALLLLLVLAPTAWNANEENYFQLAYHRAAPEKFSEHHAIFDRSNARVVAESIFGSAVKRLGYERAHFVSRICMALLYALGLAVFFAGVGVGVLESLFIITLFGAMGEGLIGGEWLFKGVEGKTLAYALLFVAFGLGQRGRWYAAIAAGIAATYLHFLVGGFWTLVLLVYQWHRLREFKRTVWSLALVVVLMAPLLIVVALDQWSNIGAAQPQGLSANFIYSEIRSDHHVAPFKGLYSFWRWFPGIVVILTLLSVLAVLQRRRLLPPIGAVAAMGLGYLLLALVIAFFDRHHYFFGKFYLFRPSSLALFFALTAIVASIKHQCSDNGRLVLALSAGAFVAASLWGIFKTQVDALVKAPAIPYKRELIAAIEANSSESDIVLIEPFDEMNHEYIRLHRDIPRPTLVSWKFVPTNPTDILRWYELIQRRSRLFANGCVEPMEPPVKLLVVFHKDVAERVRNCGDPAWRHGDAVLIRVGHHVESAH
jgi:hypothetical protein